MGYACPVCETPQADGRHLANHIAFTAMIHGDDHEAWLAEYAPGWEEAGERELAERVVESAAEIEFPPGSGDATGEREESDPHDHGDHAHDHGGGRNGRAERRPGTVSSAVAFDDEHTDIESDPEDEDDRDVAAVVAKARELTRRMHNGADSADNSEKEPTKQDDRPDRERDDGEETVENEERSDGRSE